jgi:hypothetical protein
MDPSYWKAIASIESSLNASSNYNKDVQYKGLFQIGSRGADSEWARHGHGDIYNASDNANAAAALAAENNAWFANKYGRAPSPIETYMMHQQGPGFYSKGIMTNISGNAYPGMSGPQTPQSFEQGWGRELERRAKIFGGGGDIGGGSVASNRPGSSAAAGGVRGGVASAGESTDGATSDTAAAPNEDELLDKLASIPDMLKKSTESDQPPPIQWMQIQPMMTPAMLRARMMAQAMQNQPPQTGSTS